MGEVLFARTHTFIGAREGTGPGVVIYGAPLDVTTSFRPGTRLGPKAIREYSWGLETYDLRTGNDLERMTYFDAGDIDLAPGALEESLAAIRRASAGIVAAGGRPLVFGGEHLMSLPVIEAVYERHPDVAVIHLDAHADMRLEYQGRELTHAGVMRRVSMLIGRENVYQLGIRSASGDEIEYAASLPTNFRPFDLKALEEVSGLVRGRPVYLTIDIDVVDPAFAPGTGAPEPGGVTAADLLDSLQLMRGLNIVGADIVEVAPAYDPAGITPLLAAKVARQVIFLMAGELR